MPRQIRPVRVRVTHYVDASGARVAKGARGARPVRTWSQSYYANLTIDGKRRRVPLGTADLGRAWVELRDRLRQQREKEAGISDQYTEQGARPLADHVADWLTSLRHKGTTAKQIASLRARVTLLAELAGWRRITDISPSSCLAALARLQSEGRPSGKGASAQTRNHYLTHLKQLLRWCQEERRLRDHPLIGLKPVSVESDRRHDRRIPTDEEVSRLMAAAEAGPVRAGITGHCRALCYRVAMATGFRAAELRSLTRESFDLTAGTVTVAAGYSKRRRKDTQPLPPWLVVELRQHFAAGGGLWSTLPASYPGRLLKADLKAAGIPTELDGLFLDFHSLRHWFVSWCASQPNISPKTLMALARHSTPTLTLKVYAKVRQHDLKATIDQLPAPVPLKPKRSRQKS